MASLYSNAETKKRVRKTKKKMNSRRNQPTDKYGEPIKPEDRKNYTDDDLYGVGKGPDDGKTEGERMAVKPTKAEKKAGMSLPDRGNKRAKLTPLNLGPFKKIKKLKPFVPHDKTGPHQQTRKFDDPDNILKEKPKKKKVVRTIPILPKITRKKRVAKKIKAVKARMKKRKPIEMDKREIRIFQDEAGFKPSKKITEQKKDKGGY